MNIHDNQHLMNQMERIKSVSQEHPKLKVIWSKDKSEVKTRIGDDSDYLKDLTPFSDLTDGNKEAKIKVTISDMFPVK
jgi:hypothetical protein